MFTCTKRGIDIASTKGERKIHVRGSLEHKVTIKWDEQSCTSSTASFVKKNENPISRRNAIFMGHTYVCNNQYLMEFTTTSLSGPFSNEDSTTKHWRKRIWLASETESVNDAWGIPRVTSFRTILSVIRQKHSLSVKIARNSVFFRAYSRRAESSRCETFLETLHVTIVFMYIPWRCRLQSICHRIWFSRTGIKYQMIANKNTENDIFKTTTSFFHSSPNRMISFLLLSPRSFLRFEAKNTFTIQSFRKYCDTHCNISIKLMNKKQT